MRKYAISITAGFALVTSAVAVWAQSAAPNAPSGSLSQTPTSSAQQQQADKFNTYVSKPGESMTKKVSKPDHATIVSDAQALAQSLQLSCTVTDADLIAAGPATVDGKTVNTKTYEVTCGNGMGYFLVSQPPEKSYGLSCFTADAARAVDVAAGRTPSAVCNLAANSDVKLMATVVAARAGTNCAVRDYKRIGQSTKTNTEYTEIVCTDGKGYMLAMAVPGSSAQVGVSSCHDSALQGIPCKLSDNGSVVVTVQDFKAALAEHQVSCDASQVRSIGQEKVLQRHVVEFLCPQQPKGLVAFIPLNGNTAKFETIDCAVAAKRGIACKLTP